MGGMKKALVGAALLVGLGVVAKRFGTTMFENLPDDAPPKWMFSNIAAIRDNTDRILAILDRDRPNTDSASATTTPTD